MRYTFLLIDVPNNGTMTMSANKERVMIKSFAHKGLKDFFEKGTTKGIQVKHRARLKLILSVLDSAVDYKDINFPGSNLHELKGKLKGHLSVKVNGNWRITFKFENGDAYIVNYQDYH